MEKNEMNSRRFAKTEEKIFTPYPLYAIKELDGKDIWYTFIYSMTSKSETERGGLYKMKKIVACSFFLKHLCFLALIVSYVLAVQLYFDFRAKTFQYLNPLPILIEFSPILWGALACGMLLSLKSDADSKLFLISGFVFLVYSVLIFICGIENVWIRYPDDVKASCLVLSGASFAMAWKTRKRK